MLLLAASCLASNTLAPVRAADTALASQKRFPVSCYICIPTCRLQIGVVLSPRWVYGFCVSQTRLSWDMMCAVFCSSQLSKSWGKTNFGHDMGGVLHQLQRRACCGNLRAAPQPTLQDPQLGRHRIRHRRQTLLACGPPGEWMLHIVRPKHSWKLHVGGIESFSVGTENILFPFPPTLEPPPACVRAMMGFLH